MFSELKFHPYHIVSRSPWPFTMAMAAFITTVGGTMYMHRYAKGLFILLLGLLLVTSIMGLWWRDIIREATFEGYHTKAVQESHRLGFILFIVSEVMFFFGFFWAFFHNALSPAVEIGGIWPPSEVVPFNPLGIPLINTLILLLSGAFITVTHHSLLSGEGYQSTNYFARTLIAALLFTEFQLEEYIYAPFSISDGVFGSVFYMITGLHGFHVIIGTLFMSICFIRLTKGHFTQTHHLGFEFSAWYWHFVDVVWLFVYALIYWWGGYK